MQNTTSTIIALVLAVVLILIVPMATMLERNDNVTQESAKLIVDEFVTEIQNTGKISRTAYQDFQNRLAATGNTYDIEIEVHHRDGSRRKKAAQVNATRIEETDYIEYTTQVLKQIGIKTDDENASSGDTMILKEGDMVYVSIKNDNSTAAQTLKSSFLGYSNTGEYVISASSSAMITVNGTN